MAQPTAEHGAAPGHHDAEHFFRAAYQLLGEGGQSAVTVAALCERVGVTKGSFYYHFVDLPGFVARFAKRWQGWLFAVIDDYAAEPDPMRRLELMVNSHFVTLVGPEPAIRAWAHGEPAIAEAVRAVDAHGLPLGAATCGALVGDEATGEVLARMFMCAQVGMQQRADPADRERYVQILAAFLGRCLHIRTEFVRVEGRACVKVLGPTGEPVPRFTGQDFRSSAEFDGCVLDDGIRSAMAGFTPAQDRGADAFYRAARSLLAERGPEAVTVGALCERVGVTKGSFHHHFGTMSGFVTAWVGQWETAFTTLLDYFAAEPDPARRLTLMNQATLTQAHATEMVWRALAQDHPEVRGVFHRVEQAAHEQIAQLLTEVLGDAHFADLMTEFGLGLAIGTQQMQPPLDPETFAVLGREWVRRCVGLPAEMVLVDGVPHVVVLPASIGPR